MKKRSLFIITLIVAILLFFASTTCALTIGTFNIEYFNVSGKKAYSSKQCQELAHKIISSNVDIVALQEIEGNASMRFLVTKYMPGWKFSGNDTGRRQDLYFLWREDKINCLKKPSAFFESEKMKKDGRSINLFTRAPLVGVFQSKENDLTFCMINIHLKSQSTRGKKDIEEATRYNNKKRGLQIEKVNELAKRQKLPTFILGDYNIEAPQGLSFPLLGLKKPYYSYDNKKSNLDYIGYLNINKKTNWKIYEVEGAIKSRSKKKDQSPDHDMIILVLGEKLHGKKLIESKHEEMLVYVTKTGKSYHKKDCSHLKNSSIAIPLSEAREKYSPCSRCNPPK